MHYKHGMSKHPIYLVWDSMRRRCQDSNRKDYADYGGRGIKVCERWQDSANFIEDMLPTWKPGLTLDRINNDGNYEPGNCRWVTMTEQLSNRRAYGEIPFKGVSRNGKNYRADIKIKGEQLYLGTFPTPEEASEAYQQAKIKCREAK